MSLFDGNIKLFKGTKVKGLELLSSKKCKHEIRALALAGLIDSNSDLITSTALTGISREELRGMTEVDIKRDALNIQDTHLIIDFITITYPQDVFKKQSFALVTSNLEEPKRPYSTLLLAKATSKLTHMFLYWLRSQFGVLVKSVQFSSDFMKDTLYFMLNGLPTDKTRIGDVELLFKVHTRGNSLSRMIVEIPNRDVIQFEKEADNEDVLNVLFRHLNETTAIDFHTFQISKLKCNFLTISNDGRLRLEKGIPRLGKTDMIGFTTWDFITKIYNCL